MLPLLNRPSWAKARGVRSGSDQGIIHRGVGWSAKWGHRTACGLEFISEDEHWLATFSDSEIAETFGGARACKRCLRLPHD